MGRPGNLRGRTLLRLADISVAYPNGVTALSTTNLAIAEGRFMVLLGASGAGKSTLLRTLNGLVRPQRAMCARRTGRSSQQRPLRPSAYDRHDLSAASSHWPSVGAEQRADGTARHAQVAWIHVPCLPKDRHIALTAIDRVGLLDRALDRADTCQAASNSASVLRGPCPEAAHRAGRRTRRQSGSGYSRKVLADLHRICREDGITAIVSLHQVEFARRFADRIVGLSEGRVVFDRPPAELDAAAYPRSTTCRTRRSPARRSRRDATRREFNEAQKFHCRYPGHCSGWPRHGPRSHRAPIRPSSGWRCSPMRMRRPLFRTHSR